MMRQRKKHKYLVVWIPENRWIFHSTNESTYLEVLKWIGGERISKCGLEVSHLPIVTKEPYEQYLEYMKPIGGGWYVNTIGGTDNKYMQLCTMNEKLNLGIIINLMDKNPISYSDWDKWSKWLPDIDIGKKRTRDVSDVLCVRYKRSEILFNNKKYNQILFVNVIELIGINDVCKLGLQAGRYELVTRMKLYDTQLPCGDFWVTVPSATKYRYKILLTIKALLKLDMEVSLLNESQDSGSVRKNWNNDLHKIGHEKEHERKKTKNEEISGTLFVKFKDLELLFNKGDRNKQLFVFIIELIGINDVYKLCLQTGEYELVTRMKLYDTQLPCGNFWITVPSETKYQYDILRTIKVILKLDMELSLLNESQVSASDIGEWSYDLHEIGHKKEYERKNAKNKEHSGTLYVKYKDLELLFNKGDRNRLLFVLIIELIGINDVYNLGLQTDGYELVTRMKLNDTQFQYGDFWVTVPSETIYKYNILRTIKKLLKLDMEVSLV